MSFIRPYLMGDAYVAVADEASVLFYNPAGLAKLPEGAGEVFSPQFHFDDKIRQAIFDPTALEARYSGIDQTNFQDILGESIFFNFNLRLPFIYLPGSGKAFGLGVETLAALQILQNPVLPGMHFEFFTDALMFISYFYKPTNRFQFGFTTKFIRRLGIDKTFTIGELFSAGTGLSLENDPAYKDAIDGKTFDKFGVDLGFIYRLPEWPGWFPRLGLSILNVGGINNGRLTGMEFGARPRPSAPPQAGELPQLNTVGFAVSPVFSGVRYTIAADLVDFTKTVLPGDDLAVRSRLGLEVGFGTRDDGSALISLLAGLNALHPSYGIMTRVAFWEVGFGSYTVEMGEKSGDLPDKRVFFLISIRL